LDQPFSVSVLIDLGFSAETLDPLFDNGIFGEPFPSRAEFTDSELRSELLGQMPWSKKRRLCAQVGELLRHRRDTLDEAADFFCRAHRYRDARVCRVQAAEEASHSGSISRLLGFCSKPSRSGPLARTSTTELMPLKRWHAVPVTRVSSPLHDLPGRKYWRLVGQLDRQKARSKRTTKLRNLANCLGITPQPSVL
jgi:hypothetical protein